MPDPILQTAADEINAILKKHDIAGMVFLGSKDFTHYLYGLDTTWNCLRMEGPALRLRCKREDFASEAVQKECLRLTVGIIQGFIDVARNSSDTLQGLMQAVGKHVEYSHVSVHENPEPLKIEDDPAAQIIGQVVTLCAAAVKTTPGEWRVRETAEQDDFFVERPRREGEAHGVQILADEDYETKRADAEFIVAAKKAAGNLRTLMGI